MVDRPVDIDALLALNPEFQKALWQGEPWAWEHIRICESLNAGEPEGFRRKFDGKPRKWCGAACPTEEGCIMCTLPENAEMARLNRLPRDPMELARDGTVIISGYVDHGLVVKVNNLIRAACASKQTTLTFKIESDGGFSRAGLQIFDLIREAPVQKRLGVVSRYARSAGALILQACDRREAAEDAVILIHHIRFNEVTLDALRNPLRRGSMIAAAEPDEKRIEEIFVSRTGRSLSELRDAFDRDTDMTSEQALQFGLIDNIRRDRK